MQNITSHLPDAFYCPQAFLSLDFQSRDHFLNPNRRFKFEQNSMFNVHLSHADDGYRLQVITGCPATVSCDMM